MRPFHELIALADRARRGDREALELLLRESLGIVHSLARARLGNTLAAEGAVIDVLARVALGIGRLRDAQAYPRWLSRTAARCMADAASRDRRIEAVTPPDVADATRGPLDTLVAVEQSRAVDVALARLHVKVREPLMLHFVEGLSYREVGNLLGLSLGTVSRRMHAALAELRRAFGEVT